jgi:very-short-patch-repair endonuclease
VGRPVFEVVGSGLKTPPLARVKPGRVVCLFANDCDTMHDYVQTWAASTAPPSTLVTLEWERAPRLTHGLDEAAIALARAAQSLFPALYASARQRETAERWLDPRSEQDAIETAVNDAAANIKGVSLSAARSMLEACRAGELPSLQAWSPAERIRQLALALDPEQLVIELLVHSPEPPSPGCLFAFGKGAEWLARNSRARVLMVVPERFVTSQELDAVTYDAIGARVSPDDVAGVANDNQPDARPQALKRANARRATPSTHSSLPSKLSQPHGEKHQLEAPSVSVSAVLGKPHPGSEAEIKLHRRICADAELAPLFSFNQLITTQHGMTPRVDLVWAAGKLVIEVDGHRDHSRLAKFCHDRERDYQLFVSGYWVLRVPEVQVLVDGGLMLERIRNAVRYIKEHHGRKSDT